MTSLNAAQLAALLASLQPLLPGAVYEQVAGLLGTLQWVMELIQKKNTTIARLQRLIFGASTEKTGNIFPQAPVSDPPAQARPKGHGRNGADRYVGAQRVVVVIYLQSWRGRLRLWQRQCFVKDEQHQFLALAGRLPARLTVEQTAWVLGCQAHDVPILVTARLLKPLGTPAPNGIKFFAATDVFDLAKDRSLLAKVTNTVNQHWHKKNAHQKNGFTDGALNGLCSGAEIDSVGPVKHGSKS
jgi:hypothetical protein